MGARPVASVVTGLTPPALLPAIMVTRPTPPYTQRTAHNEHPPPHGNSRRKLAAVAALALAGSSLTVGVAGFVDTERVRDNLFSAGAEFDFTVTESASGVRKNGQAAPAGDMIAWDGSSSGQNSDTNTAGTVRLNVANIAPGDVYEFDLDVANVGTLDGKYVFVCDAPETIGSGALADADDGDASDFAGTGGATLTGMGLQIQLLQGSTELNASGCEFGDSADLAGTGRDLAVGATEKLTVRVTAPTAMTQSSLGALQTINMTLHAGQGTSGGVVIGGAVAPVSLLTVSGKIDGNYSHTCVIQNGGEVWCAGQNNHGQLGDGTQTNRSTPVRVQGISDAVQISTGHYHTLALLSDGTVMGWGRGWAGTICSGNDQSRYLPTQVPNISGIVEVSAGSEHSYFRKDDGRVYACGDSGAGAIGDGSGSDAYIPKLASGINNAVQISAGHYRAGALLSDGSVKMWGQGTNGGQGDGSTGNNLTPAYVLGVSGVSKLIVGYRQAIVQLSDGSYKGWGYGGAGALLSGAATANVTPISLNDINGAVDITCKSQSCAARFSDGTWKGWGYNVHGELGLGNVNNPIYTPITITGAGMEDVVIGNGAGLFIVSPGGSTTAAGINSYGQLGTGSTGGELNHVSSQFVVDVN